MSGKKLIIIGRHIEGITINPLEYLLDNNNKIKYFESEEIARTFLVNSGFSESDLEELTFEETSLKKLEK